MPLRQNGVIREGTHVEANSLALCRNQNNRLLNHFARLVAIACSGSAVYKKAAVLSV